MSYLGVFVPSIASFNLTRNKTYEAASNFTASGLVFLFEQ